MESQLNASPSLHHKADAPGQLKDSCLLSLLIKRRNSEIHVKKLMDIVKQIIFIL